MLLISKQLKFKTKIMDIANLVLLKMSKDITFKPDLKFVKLTLSIMMKKESYTDALKFLEEKKGYFETSFEKQIQEAIIHYKAGDTISALNAYFKVLKPNSTTAGFCDLWPVY